MIWDLSLTCDAATDPETDSLASNKTRLSAVSVYIMFEFGQCINDIPYHS